MKKVFLAMILAAMTAVSVQAQGYKYFAGGSLGLDYSEGKYTYGETSTNRPSKTSFDLSPMLGYYLSENLAAGVSINLGMSTTNNRAETPTTSNSTEWGLGPFLRYTVLKRGDFSVLLQAGMGVFGSSSNTKYDSETNDGPSVLGFDISAVPILSFRLTDRVNLEVSSNLARFGFSTKTETTGKDESQSKSTDSSMGFGIDTNDFFKSPYQIGLIYKF